MTRKIMPVTTSIGGVEIVVTTATRHKVRRMARAAAVVTGYTAGIAAVVMLCVAAAQSELVWPIVVCGGVACIVTFRCMKNRGGNQYAREK